MILLNFYKNLYLGLNALFLNVIIFLFSNLYKILFFIHPAISNNGKLRITGFLLLKIHPYSNFSINGRLRINSGFRINPFYGERKTIINLNKAATLVIEDNVGISNSSIYCTNSIVIESNVMIGGGCQIYDTNFHPIGFHDRMENNILEIQSSPIRICNGAFIGGGSHICKGVTIGERAVISSSSKVVTDIPNDEIWGGNPAIFIKRIL